MYVRFSGWRMLKITNRGWIHRYYFHQIWSILILSLLYSLEIDYKLILLAFLRTFFFNASMEVIKGTIHIFWKKPIVIRIKIISSLSSHTGNNIILKRFIFGGNHNISLAQVQHTHVFLNGFSHKGWMVSICLHTCTSCP